MCILRPDFNQLDNAFQTQSIILKMMNVVLFIGFSVISGKVVVYLDKKIKGSKLDLTLVRFE